MRASVTNVTNQLVDDGFTAELTFENGVAALVEVGTSNFISLPRWYVLGTNGTAIVEDWNLNGRIVRASGVDEKDVTPVITAAGLTKTMAPRRADSIFTEELPKVKSDVRDFYRNVMAVLEGKEESLIRLDEVKRVMKLMEAVMESAEKQCVKSDVRDFYRNVMAVLEGKEESLIRLDEVKRVMKLMEAVMESAEKQCVVKFE